MPDFPYLKKWDCCLVKHQPSSAQVGRQMAVVLSQSGTSQGSGSTCRWGFGCCFIAYQVGFERATALRRAGQLEEYSPLELGLPFLSSLPNLG